VVVGGAQKSLLLQWKKNEARECRRENNEKGKRRRKICSVEGLCKNMLKSFMYFKNYKRIIFILAFLLVYISMYLIHNAYGGTLCIIKSSGDKGNNGSKGEFEGSKLYRGSNSNLFNVS
jgi:hypothetical protein